VHGNFIALQSPQQPGDDSCELLCTSGKMRMDEVLIGSALGRGVFLSGEQGLLLNASLDLGDDSATAGGLTVLVTLRCTVPPKKTLVETHVLHISSQGGGVEELFRFKGKPSKPQATP